MTSEHRSTDRALKAVCVPKILFKVLIPMLSSSIALAEVNVYEGDRVNVLATFSAAFAHNLTDNNYFGRGRENQSATDRTGDVAWSEAYVYPQISSTLRALSGEFRATLSSIATLVSGDGDAGGFTNADDGKIDFEELLVGYKFNSTNGINVDLSIGKQRFEVANGFLLGDGNLDQFDKGAYWLSPRQAFHNSAIATMWTSKLQLDLFYLDSDQDNDHTETAGFNFQYRSAQDNQFGLMFFRIVDTAPNSFDGREGMNVLNLRIDQLKIPYLNELSLTAEYVVQHTAKGVTTQSDAWYGELQYASELASKVVFVSYRYSYYSGSEQDAGVSRAFDPLFYDDSFDYGTWTQGEITGNYFLFNSNQRTHAIHASIEPNKVTKLGMLYYSFSLAEKNFDGQSVSNNAFADELNFYAEWEISSHATVIMNYALAMPNLAAKEAIGENNFHQLNAMIDLAF